MVYVVAAVVLLVVLLGLMWYIGRRAQVSAGQARQQFLRQREHLEADFLRAAQASGMPRGLVWVECEWGPEVEVARDRSTGLLVALAGVTIRFEAVPGSDMEGLPAVGNLRNATGLFYFADGRWRTRGAAVFNHNPAEVLSRFSTQYERVVPC